MITLKMNVRTTLVFLRDAFGNVDVCHRSNDAGRAVSVICDSGVRDDVDIGDIERGSRRRTMALDVQDGNEYVVNI